MHDHSGRAWMGRAGAIAALLAAALALPAAAQTGCAEGFANSRAEPPLLDAFTPLFRQNGVAFHARVFFDRFVTVTVAQ